MVSLHPALKKAYWGLAGAGALYAVFMLCLTNVTIQRKYANSSRDSPCSKTLMLNASTQCSLCQ